MIGYTPVVTMSVAKQIADRLQQAILNGEVKSNERLPTEDELAIHFGVSRPTVREALKRLAAKNLVRSRRGAAGGNFVNEPHIEDFAENLISASTMLAFVGNLEMKEILEARVELEEICCSMAIDNYSKATAKAAAKALKLQKSVVTDEEFCASDVAFHRAIVEGTKNAMLRFVMYAVIESLVPVTNMVIVYVRDRKQIIQHHEHMLTAYQARDKKSMSNSLRQLMTYLDERYAEAILQRDLRQKERSFVV